MITLLSFLSTALFAQTPNPATVPEATSRQESNRPLNLSEFRPFPQLHVPRTEIVRASFPVVDVHTHFFIRARHDPAALLDYVALMDRNRIAISVSLDGTLGDRLPQHIEYLWSAHRNRFVIFANIDWKNDPEFVTRTVQQLRFAKELGVSGLKIFKQLGLEYKNSDETLVRIDDERWDPIWEACGKLGLPVIMHTADPSAFFEEIDPTNERYEELARRPEWSFAKPGFPSRDQLHQARNRVIQRHPATTFIAAHFGNDAEDLAETSQWLDQHPNLVVEFASRISELGRQPRTARSFFEKYQDRILFGTDGPWSEPRLNAYWRFLETADEYFPYSEKNPPPQGLWNIYGIDLPDSILKKIYFENACRLIPGVKEKLELSGG